MKKLYRSQDDKMVAGICGGLGERFSVDTTLIRLAMVFIGVASGLIPMVAAYIVGWIIIPVAPQEQETKIT